MRSGFTTSACAAAASVAAARALLTGQAVWAVDIDLPALRQVHFVVCRCERDADSVLCGVIKDAGDDPDATHGLEIQVRVARSPQPGIQLCGGKGVGVVTLPGLPAAVGEAAINPGPRRLIRQILQRELDAQGFSPAQGFTVTIQVPEGERIAAQTMNPQLGIVGGISILGTDGIVRPYSAPAFRASLFYELNVALQAGYTTIGLATGKRSAAALAKFLGDTRGLGVLDVGDELGYPLQQAARLGFQQVTFGGMIGKFSKLAQGRLQTHVKDGEVDFDFLAALAAGQGAPDELCARIRNARTAHQVQAWLQEIGIHLEAELALQSARQAAAVVADRLAVQVLIFSLDGELLAQASSQEVAHG